MILSNIKIATNLTTYAPELQLTISIPIEMMQDITSLHSSAVVNKLLVDGFEAILDELPQILTAVPEKEARDKLPKVAIDDVATQDVFESKIQPR